MSKQLKLAPAIAAALAMAGAPASGTEDDEVSAAVAAVEAEAAATDVAKVATEPVEGGSPSAASEPAESENASLLAHLKAENKQLRQEFMEASLSARDANKMVEELKAKAAADAASIEALSASVVQACTNMSVALNTTVVGLSSMSPLQLKGTFDELRASLNSRFAVGAKSSTSATGGVPSHEVEEKTSIQKAALAATTINNKRV